MGWLVVTDYSGIKTEQPERRNRRRRALKPYFSHGDKFHHVKSSRSPRMHDVVIVIE